MNLSAPSMLSDVVSETLVRHINTACARIAPTWPLDQFIAVNPYWGWLNQPIEAVGGALGSLAGSRLMLPRSWFQAEWAAGRLTHAHLCAAAEHAGLPHEDEGEGAAQADALVRELVVVLEDVRVAEPESKRLPLVTDLRDAVAPPRPGLSWAELVTHQVSQHCAAYFDEQQAAWGMDPEAGLYGTWRQQLVLDHGLPWQKGRADLVAQVSELPTDARASIASSLAGLRVDPQGQQAYLSAVLLSIGGWAAWCAYLRWQARLGTTEAADDDHIEQLLAIRLAWEWLLYHDAPMDSVPGTWAAQWLLADHAAAALASTQRIDWLLQHALEIAEQQRVIARLMQSAAQGRDGNARPAVQALFCIDVRSEVFRRALEAADAGVRTRGFAGFFGLPIAYQPLGGALTRPQLPGLLAPALKVTETAMASDGIPLASALAIRRQGTLQWRERWAAFKSAPSSGFSFVESLGLLYGGKLLGSSLASDAAPRRWEDTGLPPRAAVVLRPTLPGADSDAQAAGALAHGILRAIGLVDNFAPLVLLAGHGSQSANNPHAAGLECGACGGQSGEVNARVLADLLNRPPVRAEVAALGIDIPADTHFLPALHNTTTDDVLLFDVDAVPANLAQALQALTLSLAAAGAAARAERATNLGLGALVSNAAALHQAVRERANDWSQVRPEWGLAGNASFIVAPRARTKNIDLAGRSFLHDYDHRLDPANTVLTLIMTAPMVVTNWINLQYHASTVDNRRYGSGNKLLHNVVGGHIGVFEGNGGDLRIGLPLQSLHDGECLRHTPLRLSVYIEAPHAAIESVMVGHAGVRDLVNNRWLHLFCIDPKSGLVSHYWRGAWREWGQSSPSSVELPIAVAPASLHSEVLSR